MRRNGILVAHIDVHELRVLVRAVWDNPLERLPLAGGTQLDRWFGSAVLPEWTRRGYRTICGPVRSGTTHCAWLAKPWSSIDDLIREWEFLVREALTHYVDALPCSAELGGFDV